MALTPTRIREIAQLTIGQRKNQLWHDYRANRFTASQFGKILKIYKDTSANGWSRAGLDHKRESLVKKPPEHAPPLVWGEEHEGVAMKGKQVSRYGKPEYGFSQTLISLHLPMGLFFIQLIQTKLSDVSK